MLLILRSTLLFIAQAVTAIFFSITGSLLFFFPFAIRYRYITLWSHIVIALAKIICGIQYKIEGLENLPTTNAIILCKHQSAWETLFLQVLLPPQSWVLKKELLQIPFFGWGLSLLEPIAIDRKKSSSIKQLLDKGKKRLQQGRWVILFPEGTRVPLGETRKYSRSGALLAKEAGYPLVPIAHNAGTCWPKSAFIKQPGIITVVIGKPLDPQAYSVDELHTITQEWIETTSRQLLDNASVDLG